MADVILLMCSLNIFAQSLCFERLCVTPGIVCVQLDSQGKGFVFCLYFSFFLSVFYKEVLWNCSQRVCAGSRRARILQGKCVCVFASRANIDFQISKIAVCDFLELAVKT